MRFDRNPFDTCQISQGKKQQWVLRKMEVSIHFHKLKASTTLFIKPISLVNMVRCPFNTLTKIFKPPTKKNRKCVMKQINPQKLK
jgi:hypothetical protein